MELALSSTKKVVVEEDCTIHAVAVAFTGYDTSLANDIPSIDTLEASQIKEVSKLFTSVSFIWHMKRSESACITSISCAPYSLIMVFGIDDIIKLKILALSNGSHRCPQ